MSRVITFSRVFPSYHPRAGERTLFVEKIVAGFVHINLPGCGTELIKSLRDEGVLKIMDLPYQNYKYHTIRSGHRWKVGDKFSPRVWSGKPYRSKQITIAPDIEVKKVWDFGMRIRGFKEFYSNDVDLTFSSIEAVAKNDGLYKVDFLNWFNKPFVGQIICWNDSITY